MKKALAFILASFVFASVFFKSIPAKASDFAIPQSGWLPVIYDIFYSLVNGNEIDVAQLAGELSGINAIIEKYDEYRNTHFETGIEGGLSLINNSLFTYAASMYEGDLYDLAAQYSIYIKDGTYPMLGRYTKDRIARWNQYNTQFNDLYLENFSNDSDVVPVFPDADYLSYIDTINGSGFYFENYDRVNNSQTYITNPFTNNIVTWLHSRNYNNWTSYLYASPLMRIDINSTQNNTYTVSLSNYSRSFYTNTNNSNMFAMFTVNDNVLELVQYNTYNSAKDVHLYTSAQLNTAFSGEYPSLSNVFSTLSNYFRNVDIYVDNVAWSLVSVPETTDIVVPPSVIRNDNGLIDSQDVFVPDQELAFDLIGLINLLEDKLNGIDTTIDFDDLITDGIIVNPDGTALEDARTHILDMTIQRVIADEQERDDPEPVATTTPPPYPTFPEVDWRKNPIPEPLPTGFDTSNGNPADAFSGASTLAQIVDATNRGLPSELVYTFWGIVFGMIVLGVIKVLHK